MRANLRQSNVQVPMSHFCLVAFPLCAVSMRARSAVSRTHLDLQRSIVRHEQMPLSDRLNSMLDSELEEATSAGTEDIAAKQML